jgi:hypothetical protein
MRLEDPNCIRFIIAEVYMIFSKAINQFKFRRMYKSFLEMLLPAAAVILFSIVFLLSYENTTLGIEPASIYFGDEINISKNNGTSELPQITAEGNNVYVVWQDNTNGNYDVYFKSSSTNGTKFKSIRNLSKNNGTSELPQIATYKDLVCVLWKDTTSGTDTIFFKDGQKENSTNITEFGSSNKLVSNGNVSKPKIVAGLNFFSGVWTSNLGNASAIEFYPLKFFDNSNNPIQLTKLSSKDSITSVSIFGHNNDIYLVWENKKISNGDIFFKKISTTFFDRNG